MEPRRSGVHGAFHWKLTGAFIIFVLGFSSRYIRSVGQKTVGVQNTWPQLRLEHVPLRTGDPKTAVLRAIQNFSRNLIIEEDDEAAANLYSMR